MKILLFYPRCLNERVTDQDHLVLPIGLYSIAALLIEKGYEVEIINCYDFDPGPENLKNLFRQKKPDVIGCSVYNPNRWGALDIARTAKEVLPDSFVVFGGVAATFMWKHFLRHFDFVDAIVLGEGEYTFLNLLKELEKGEKGDVSRIKGLGLRKNGQITSTGEAEFIQDLDKLPIPAKYFTYNHLSLSRGCPGNSSFCASPRFWKRKVRFHSADYFVEELELLTQKGINFFYISDDTFTLKKSLVIEVCQKILARNLDITWVAISRVDRIDEEVLYWMRKAGCIQISFGVESGSEKIRQKLNKKFTTEQIIKAFELTRCYGILPRAYFIYGSPGETRQTIQESVKLMQKIKPLSAVFYVLHLFPGTSLFDEYRQKAKLSDRVWLEKREDFLYFELDQKIKEKDILKFGKTLRSKFYTSLPGFALEIKLQDIKEFYPLYADFYSRLAMTFTHGDYARIEGIPDKEQVAQELYARSLTYSPNIRAYLGLGILAQKKGGYLDSVTILKQGVTYFPNNDMLNISLGISFMNLGQYDQALKHFLPFEHNPQALTNIVACYHALKDYQRRDKYLRRLEVMKMGR